MPRIEVFLGSITDTTAECLVNAAKPSLLGGGGVDGAIHAAAGPELRNECRTLNGCLPGQAVITGAYELNAKYVVHTVAPRYGFCNSKEESLLESCYRESIKLADTHGIKSIAFPSLGTGAYGYPKELAASIAVKSVKDALKETSIVQVIFVVTSEEEKQLYQDLLAV